MSSTIQHLFSEGLIALPPFVHGSVQYETIMGSEAYGVSSGDSDRDIYGFCIPPKHMVFPHLAGKIDGFGRQKKRFDVWQKHHIFDQGAYGGRGCEYDLAVYSIVRYFHLCMEGNPNMVNSLFTPRRCVIFSTQLAERVRENRQMFLHKGMWHRFKGYAYSQLHKMDTKNPTGKRKETIEKFGYDTKFAYHCIRLICEVEQILVERDLDMQRDREMLKAIRRGDWPVERVREFFYEKESALERIYETSDLPHTPREEEIRILLLECLEIHYGGLDKCVQGTDFATTFMEEVETVVDRWRYMEQLKGPTK